MRSGGGGRPSAAPSGLTVAVTGPTGTLGHGLIPLLDRDDRVTRVIGIARRPFDPDAEGWAKMTYRRGGGARRFVYSSSAAAYGFHSDNPDLIGEDWPIRPDHRFFYAEEKAEVEQLLAAAGATGRAACQLRIPIPVALPAVQLQFVHEDEVGSALMHCVHGVGPAGAYNIAGDGILTAHDVARELGLMPVPFPVALAGLIARTIASASTPSFVPPVLGWAQVATRPVLVDTTKAKAELHWSPVFTGLAALRSTRGTRSERPVPIG